LNGLDESGKDIPMFDPMAPKLRERAKAAGKDAHQLLGMREVFSEELASAPAFSKRVSDILNSFYEEGATATLVKSYQLMATWSFQGVPRSPLGIGKASCVNQ
jgi:mannitol-1-phosphate/altronate dehydrogenase